MQVSSPFAWSDSRLLMTIYGVFYLMCNFMKLKDGRSHPLDQVTLIRQTGIGLLSPVDKCVSQPSLFFIRLSKLGSHCTLPFNYRICLNIEVLYPIKSISKEVFK